MDQKCGNGGKDCFCFNQIGIGFPGGMLVFQKKTHRALQKASFQDIAAKRVMSED